MSMDKTIYQQRQRRLREKLDWDQYKAAVITDLLSVYYLSGFHGHEAGDGWFLLTPEKGLVFSDSRYAGTLKRLEIPHIIWPMKDRFDCFIAELPAKPGPLGFQTSITYAGLEKLKETLNGYKLSPLPDAIEDLRLRKDDAEIAEIRAAAKVTDRVLQESLGFIKAGMTEIEVKTWLNSKLREYSGTDDIAFGTIVASGTNGDTPHAEPSDKKIEAGEFITIDMGARNGLYHSDMTRTVLVGGAEPDPKMVEIYNAVLESQIAGVEAVKPGVTCASVDNVCRDSLGKAGFGEYFAHGTGHGVGLEIHEGPNLSPRSGDVVLEPGMIVTVEPGVYVPGLSGVRIEDLVLVTEDGHERLSHTVKDLESMTILG